MSWSLLKHGMSSGMYWCNERDLIFPARFKFCKSASSTSSLYSQVIFLSANMHLGKS